MVSQDRETIVLTIVNHGLKALGKMVHNHGAMVRNDHAMAITMAKQLSTIVKC